MISNCGQDEWGGYTGGSAGDQTGREWEVRTWYPRPWNCVLRHPCEDVRNLHAQMARAAALNPRIGYDQGQRDSFGEALRSAGDDPAKITVSCETDCSKGIIDITKAIGRRLGREELRSIGATYTGNMRSAYRAAGYQVLTDAKYLTSDAYLLPGDILLNDQHHVATNLDAGTRAGGSVTAKASSSINRAEKYKAVVVDTDGEGLNVRTWAGAEYPKCSFSPLMDGQEVVVCDTVRAASGNPWAYIRVRIGGCDKYGFAAAAYLKQI